MRIYFLFLLAKDLCRFLLIMRPHNIFNSPVHRGYILRVSVHLVQNIFHMIAVLTVFLAANKIYIYDKNNIKSIQRQDRDDAVLLLATRWKKRHTKEQTGAGHRQDRDRIFEASK